MVERKDEKEIIDDKSTRERVADVVPGVLEEADKYGEETEFVDMLLNARISYERDHNGDLRIGLQGVDIRSRYMLMAEVKFQSGVIEYLDGVDIARGGAWVIPREKSKSITGVSLQLKSAG